MLKTVHTLTIRDYSLFEKTGDLKYLFDGKVKSVDVSELLQEIATGLNGENENSNKLQKDFHKVKSQYRIQLLITLYEAAYNLMVLQADVNTWKGIIGKEPTKLKNLKRYVDKIKSQTGIEIKEISDLAKLKNEIQRWVDKFAETFPEKDNDPNGVTFMQIVLGVFASSGMDLNYEMYMSDFFELKDQVELMNKTNQNEKTN